MNSGNCALLVDGESAPVVLEVVGEVYEVRKVSARWHAWLAGPVKASRGDCTWTEVLRLAAAQGELHRGRAAVKIKEGGHH
jgi:hypothetical protein